MISSSSNVISVHAEKSYRASSIACGEKAVKRWYWSILIFLLTLPKLHLTVQQIWFPPELQQTGCVQLLYLLFWTINGLLKRYLKLLKHDVIGWCVFWVPARWTVDVFFMYVQFLTKVNECIWNVYFPPNIQIKNVLKLHGCWHKLK